MKAFDHLSSLMKEQIRITSELEQAVKDAENTDLLTKNTELLRKTEQLSVELKNTLDELKKLTNENKSLKTQLQSHMLRERSRLYENFQNKANAYFADQMTKEKDNLLQLRELFIGKCNEYTEYLRKNRVEVENELFSHVEDLKKRANEAILEQKRLAEEAEQELHKLQDEKLKQLKEEPLSMDAVIRQEIKTNMESFLGLNILNKLGVALIILGVILLGHLANEHITNEVRSAFIFLLGLLMLGGGEFLNKKKANVFSLGLTGGGVAVLYIAVAISFFYMNLLSAPVAFVLCVLISFVSLLLSYRYNAQVIAVFALIGGFSSVIFIRSDAAYPLLIYYELAYFTLLGVFSLLLSFIKKWYAAQYMGFFGQLIAISGGILSSIPSGYQIPVGVALTYVLLFFMIYSLIPLISTYRTKAPLETPDHVLMGINIFLGSAIIFFTLSAYQRTEWNDIFLLVLCAWHLVIARMSESFLKSEKTFHAIAYITGLGFAVIIVPSIFGLANLSMGWLVQGTALLVCGLIMKNRSLRIAGWVIFGMCLAIFLMFDFMNPASLEFYVRYLSITICSALIAFIYFYCGAKDSNKFKVLKTLVLVNIWWFSVFTVQTRLIHLLPEALPIPQRFFFLNMLTTAITFLWAYIIARNKYLTDNRVRIVSTIASILAILYLLGVNSGFRAFSMPETPTGFIALGVITAIIINLISVFVFIDVVKYLTVRRTFSIEWYPVFIASFILLLMTQNLYIMMDLRVSSAVFTLLFAVAALCFISFGFIKRFLYIRLVGLGVSFAVVAKFIFVDLAFQGTLTRIISVFSLGISLLVISFIYQYFDKELKKSAKPDEGAEKDD